MSTITSEDIDDFVDSLSMKPVSGSKSSLILKSPKTNGSFCKAYLTTLLLAEIQERMSDIEIQKAFFHDQYHDYGLLTC